MPELLRGDAARAALADPSFVAEWDALHAACPWASVFQGSAFLRVWARHYVPNFELVLLRARDAGGALTGLLPLCVPAGGGSDFVGAGGLHSEYQTFLARPGDADAFMAACLERLATEVPGGVVRLAYVPAATPLGWAREGRWATHAYLRAAPRLVADTADPEIARDLGKRATRWRIKRFEQHGPLRFDHVRDVAEFDRLAPEIVDVCDFRQAAANGVTPFRSDPRKLPLHRDLLLVPDMLHVTAMRAGDRLISVQLNMLNGPEVLLCVLGHHPAAARHSPGHIHMLMLAGLLATEGVPGFDLSPEGSYKERLGSERDVTHSVHVHLSRASATRFRVARRVMVQARRVLARTGLSADTAREVAASIQGAVAEVGAGALPGLVAREVRNAVAGETVVTVYERARAGTDAAPTTSELAEPSATGVVQDDLGQLLVYQRAHAGLPTRQDFLSRAMRWLSLGEHAFTLGDDSRLRAWAWLAPTRSKVAAEELGREAQLPPGSALVHDVRAANDDPALAGRVLDAALGAVAGRADVQRVYVLVGGGDDVLRRAVEARGFSPRFQVVQHVRFGRVQVDGELPAEFVPPPPPAPPAAGGNAPKAREEAET
jgi:CelD/BcsL family acetyltransferase involved in cellulose biosynthesis